MSLLDPEFGGETCQAGTPQGDGVAAIPGGAKGQRRAFFSVLGALPLPLDRLGHWSRAMTHCSRTEGSSEYEGPTTCTEFSSVWNLGNCPLA